jgi:hypothetical protein
MRFSICLAVLMLGACSAADDTSANGATQGESDALNNAAEMLDKQGVSPPLAERPQITPPKTPDANPRD